MFTNCYQSGLYIELYSQQNKDLKKNWKFSGKIINEYDQVVKTYVSQLITGGASKMSSPKTEKDSLGIVQSYIVFQLYVFSLKSFCIEISISDTSKTKRRIMFSTSSKEIIINPLHCRVPLPLISMNKWINLSVDVLSFVSECFKTLTFRSIDFISLSGNCKIRKIFTMRNPLPDENSNNFLFNGKKDDYSYNINDAVPKAMNFPLDVPYDNINVNFERTQTANNDIIILMNNNGNTNLNAAILSPINKNMNINVQQLTNNMQALKPISMTHHIANFSNKENMIGMKPISSVTQPINNFQSNLNILDIKGQIETTRRSKSNNKREIKSNVQKLPDITKHTKIQKSLKNAEKAPTKDKPSLKLPQIGVKKVTKSSNEKKNNHNNFNREKQTLEEIKTLEEEKKPFGDNVNNLDEIGKWDNNKENDEFEEFEKKVGIEIKNNQEEKKNKNIVISENLSSIHEQDSFEKLDKYYDIPIKKTYDEKEKGKINFSQSKNTLLENKNDKKSIIEEIFKDNIDNEDYKNLEEKRQFTPPFSNINSKN